MRRTLKLIDFSAQALIITAMVFSILSALVAGVGYYAMWAMVLAFPLGIWQIVSAIVTSIAKDSYAHGLYAFAAISYCIASIGLIYLGDRMDFLHSAFVSDEVGLYLFWLFWIPPAIGAFWYLGLTYQDLVETQEVMV